MKFKLSFSTQSGVIWSMERRGILGNLSLRETFGSALRGLFREAHFIYLGGTLSGLRYGFEGVMFKFLR